MLFAVAGAVLAARPDRTAAVGAIHVSPSGSDSNSGAIDAPLKTVQRALDIAQPGDTVNLRSGTYIPAVTYGFETKRDGTATAPITVQSFPGERAQLRSTTQESSTGTRILQVRHAYYRILNLDLKFANHPLWVVGGDHGLYEGLVIGDASGECTRFRNAAQYNTFRGNKVGPCGVGKFGVYNPSKGAIDKNGEGSYVGTSGKADQLNKNVAGNEGGSKLCAPGNSAPTSSQVRCVIDATIRNVFEDNIYEAFAGEAIEFKEGAEFNIARNNVSRPPAGQSLGQRDNDGAAFGARGDNNQFIDNKALRNAGSGVRTGGHTITNEFGVVGTRTFGKNNVFRGNVVDGAGLPGGVGEATQGHAYKFMVSPQDVDCTNTAREYKGQLYYFGNGTFPISCGNPPPAPTNTPVAAPTNTPVAAPTSTPVAAPTNTPVAAPTNTPAPAPTNTPVAAPTNTPIPASTTQIKVTATDDARVRKDEPSKNYGSESTTRIDSEPETDAYLKFKAVGASGRAVASAKVRLYVTESGISRSLKGVSNSSWTEGGVTYNNRPAIDGPLYGSSTSKVSSGAYVEFDVSAAVRSDGTYSFALESLNTDGTAFASSEYGTTSKRPQLIVNLR